MPQPDHTVKISLPDQDKLDEDILKYFDICDVVAFFNYTNRMAHGLDMIPNREYHKMDR